MYRLKSYSSIYDLEIKMPVNLSAPQSNSLLPVKGVQLGFAEANIRKKNRKDILVIKLSEGARVAGVFTKNQFCAAPVTLCEYR